VENAENDQEEEARNLLPIDDRKDTLDVATDPKDNSSSRRVAGIFSAHSRVAVGGSREETGATATTE
jgi:hypothetical protein